MSLANIQVSPPETASGETDFNLVLPLSDQRLTVSFLTTFHRIVGLSRRETVFHVDEKTVIRVHSSQIASSPVQWTDMLPVFERRASTKLLNRSLSAAESIVLDVKKAAFVAGRARSAPVR